MKKVIAMILATLMVLSLIACAAPAAKAPEAEAPAAEEPKATETKEDEGPIKVALIVNQRFGDGGVVDQMVEGLKRASEDFGFEYAALESIEEAKYYDDIAAMCDEGYDLILTCFGYMQEAVKQAATDYPEVCFSGIQQIIEGYPNISTTDWHTEKCTFISGVLAGSMTKANHVGFILGADEHAANNEGNGFMQGVKYANPDAVVEFVYNNSYEDIDAAKTRAEAMIALGCDMIGTDLGLPRIGVAKAAQEASSEVIVHADTAVAEGFDDTIASNWLTAFDVDVYNSIERFISGNFVAGPIVVTYDDGIMKYSDEVTAAFKAANPALAADLDAAWAKVDEALAAVEKGEFVLEYITDQPNWEAILAR